MTGLLDSAFKKLKFVGVVTDGVRFNLGILTTTHSIVANQDIIEVVKREKKMKREFEIDVYQYEEVLLSD